jgi:hypothetical protein
MRPRTRGSLLAFALLLAGLYIGWELFVLIGLPGLSVPQRVLLSLLGMVLVFPLGLCIARYRGGSALDSTGIVGDFLAPRPRGPIRYLALTLLFGSIFLVWWIVGLLGLPRGMLTEEQRIVWGVVGIPSLVLTTYFFARYWYAKAS